MLLFLKLLKWGAISIAVAFAVLVVYRMFVLWDKQKTDDQVARIHATKLTLDDVMGKNLPPDPGADADKTVQGIDANHNNIRDDVELAIFKEYPNSARIRAAELQYAMALQAELTQVFNSGTLVAVIQEEGRGNVCILDLRRTKEIEELVFNTDIRKKTKEDLHKKFMTSYALPNSDYCDIDPKTFTN